MLPSLEHELAHPRKLAFCATVSRLEAIDRHVDDEPDLVTVMLGTNDLLSGLSAEEIAGRMERFLDSLTEPGKPVLLISPPILQYGEWVLDDEPVEESMELGALYEEAAERKGCLFADSGEWDIDMTFDGVHFSPEGHAGFARELNGILKNFR